MEVLWKLNIECTLKIPSPTAQKDDKNYISKCASIDQKYSCNERAQNFASAAFGAAKEMAQRLTSAVRASHKTL